VTSPSSATTESVVRYRSWQSDDSLDEITGLLHLAYRVLADQGFNYTATYQDVSTTLRRLQNGQAFVAEQAGTIIGTITLYAPGPKSSCAWYTHAAHFGQFAVRPGFQRCGVGSRLLELVETRAKTAGVAELALDTAEGATKLCSWYERRGYRLVQHVTWSGKTYRSVVLSKTL